ncbi:MAG: hypothetical protein GVY06_01415 [Alphaproteobacteria bacterium]|jgi:hypothetical protein|nr:hypothetical protein [Alphaproteobacteria bacterium]
MQAILVALLAGIGLALAALSGMRLVGLHADRGVHSVVLIAIAVFYVVFAVEHGEAGEIAFQSLLALAFTALALLGYRRSLWWVVAGLALHGVYDIAVHGHGANPAPDWWGPFCLGVDLMLALGLAVWIRRGAVRA